jgi:hypothetical protein
MAQSSQSPKSGTRKPLTAERLRELLHYDPETGVWTWRKLPIKNQLKPGGRAGTADSGGYVQIRIDGPKYGAARLAWLYMRGCWPEAEIDHKDGNRSNNRWSNLREASHSENQWNMSRRRDNTSGFKGVNWHKGERKWHARIMLHGRHIHLGSFDSAEVAYEAYKAKALELFGEFARLG